MHGKSLNCLILHTLYFQYLYKCEGHTSQMFLGDASVISDAQTTVLDQCDFRSCLLLVRVMSSFLMF